MATLFFHFHPLRWPHSHSNFLECLRYLCLALYFAKFWPRFCWNWSVMPIKRSLLPFSSIALTWFLFIANSNAFSVLVSLCILHNFDLAFPSILPIEALFYSLFVLHWPHSHSDSTLMPLVPLFVLAFFLA